MTLIIRIFTLFVISCVLVTCTNETNEIPVVKTSKKCASFNQIIAKAATELHKNNNLKQALTLYKKACSIAKQCNSCNREFFVFFEVGNYYYSISQYDNALDWYKKALENKRCANDYKNIAGINTNIGVIYLGKGYLKSAISYFISARKAMEIIDKKNQNYWINFINIGVAFMEMDDLASAKRVFAQIDADYSPAISFLVAINLAKIAGIKKDEATFNQQIIIADKLISKVQMYQNTLDELKLEFYIRFLNKSKLSQLFQKKIATYSLAHIYTKLLLQQANIIQTNTVFGGNKELETLRIAALKENDFNCKLAYFELIKLIHLKQNNYKGYAEALTNIILLNDKKRIEKTTTALKDYQILIEKTTLKRENEQLKTQRKINLLKIKNQRYLNFFLIISSLFLVVLGLYLYSYFKRKEKTKSIVIVEISKDLETSHEKHYSLQQKLRNQELRMEEILKTAGKIAILRKQIETYFNNTKIKNMSLEDAAELKKAKLDVDLFFNNYTELAIIASQKETYSLEKLRINNLFKDTLSDKELTVLSLIMNNYSSREIGVLLNKTEKAIEYTRKNIREKLGVDGTLAIPEFVQNKLKLMDV